jgi:uncharacterized protein
MGAEPLMRAARLGALVLLVAVGCSATAALAVEVPPLEGRVNDRAALLTPDARTEIERKLAEYEVSSGHQFAVLTVPSLEGEAIEAFSLRVVESWKLGRKGKDDGLLMMVVKEPHGIRIEVGYGLEGSIPDALAGRIVRNVMAPAFRAGDFAAGIERGLDLLMTAGSGGTVVLAEPPARKADGPSWQLLLALMFLLPFGAVILVAALVALFGRRPGSRAASTNVGYTGVDGSGSSGHAGSSRSGGGNSSDGGGFSGGGGDFGGGGASGSW